MSPAQPCHEPQSDVAPLRPRDIARLNAAGHPRVDEVDIEQLIRAAPGQSFWVPGTGEFILVQPWRNRPELPHVHTLWSFSHDDVLIAAAARAARVAGAASLVMLNPGERRRPGFYQRHGFQKVEVIRTYEHIAPERLAGLGDVAGIVFHRVSQERDHLLPEVEAIDNAAFPWFWWNTREEFLDYLAMPTVELWAGVVDKAVVSYVGMTQFRHWAHLDRIAVAPDAQRSGIGRQTLGFAARRMIAGGAVRIALSTQSSNQASRRLYEALGFRHTRVSDYDVHGIVFEDARVFGGPAY